MPKRGKNTQGGRGIEQLIRPPQGRISHGISALASTDPTPLLTITLVIEVLPKPPEVSTAVLRHGQHTCRWQWVCHNEWPPRSRNVGLLKPNVFASVSQVSLMVQVHRSQDRGVIGQDINGIQTTTQSNFEDRQVDLTLAHQTDSRQSDHLKKGEPLLKVDRSLCLSDSIKRLHPPICTDRNAINRETLFESQQVGGAINRNTIASLLGHAGQHGAGGAFAIGPCHNHSWTGKTNLRLSVHGQAHGLGYLPDPV